MTVLVSERTDGPKAALARRLGLPVVTNDWVRECYMRKQLPPCQPFLLLDRSVEVKEEVLFSADSDQCSTQILYLRREKHISLLTSPSFQICSVTQEEIG